MVEGGDSGLEIQDFRGKNVTMRLRRSSVASDVLHMRRYAAMTNSFFMENWK